MLTLQSWGAKEKNEEGLTEFHCETLVRSCTRNRIH